MNVFRVRTPIPESYFSFFSSFYLFISASNTFPLSVHYTTTAAV